MDKGNKVFFNCVINYDLFYMVCDYLRFSRGAAKDYGIESYDSFDKISFEDWKEFAEGALWWVKQQYKFINVPNREEGTDPNWSTLYYMMLAYAHIYKVGQPTVYNLTKEQIQQLAQETFEWLQKLINEMREPIEDVDF